MDHPTRTYQLYAISHTQQGRQREPCIKTLCSPLTQLNTNSFILIITKCKEGCSFKHKAHRVGREKFTLSLEKCKHYVAACEEVIGLRASPAESNLGLRPSSGLV